MERPAGPQRKSSASDAEEVHGKAKAPRKSFVVGGASKNHHRVPSYGKKLNQLGKLTALTTTDQKPAQDATTHNSPRRASIHRSHSQKSLSEHKVNKRTGSTQNLQKLRRSSSHHGSTARLTALKPMTKVADNPDSKSKADDPQESGAAKTAATAGKRATFVIEDEEEDDTDDVASSFANKVFMHEKPDHRDTQQDNKENDKASVPTTDAKGSKSGVNDHDRGHVSLVNGHQQHDTNDNDVTTQQRSTRTPSNPVGLLLGQSKKAVDPQLTTDAAISKDIQGKSRPSSGQMTPINSQPLTSRFLESPRTDSLPSALHISSTYTQRDHDSHPQGASAPRTAIQQMYHSPHGSTTNLGAGASRTQQKLLLQRASSIRDLDGEIEDRDAAKNNNFVHPRAQKEFDRISREYKNAKRFRDPLKELSSRLYCRGLALAPKESVQPLRRTMTQMALNGQASELRTPKVSQSSTNLRQTHSAQSAKSTGGEDVQRLLKLLWLKDDHIPNLEE